MKYDSLLMLSGGKDSCALAFQLKAEGQEVLAFTLDNSFLSEIGKSNIDKTLKILGMTGITFRPMAGEYQSLIDAHTSLLDTCTKCSLKTLFYALDMAKLYNIKKIYAGFTSYTSQAQALPMYKEQRIGDMTIIYPYVESYDMQAIKQLLLKHNIEYDPTKTNCIHIKDLIARDTQGCLEKEFNLLFKDKQMDLEEFNYYEEFFKSCKSN